MTIKTHEDKYIHIDKELLSLILRALSLLGTAAFLIICLALGEPLIKDYPLQGILLIIIGFLPSIIMLIWAVLLNE